MVERLVIVSDDTIRVGEAKAFAGTQVIHFKQFVLLENSQQNQLIILGIFFFR